jgi:hypothetical protein
MCLIHWWGTIMSLLPWWGTTVSPSLMGDYYVFLSQMEGILCLSFTDRQWRRDIIVTHKWRRDTIVPHQWRRDIIVSNQWRRDIIVPHQWMRDNWWGLLCLFVTDEGTIMCLIHWWGTIMSHLSWWGTTVSPSLMGDYYVFLSQMVGLLCLSFTVKKRHTSPPSVKERHTSPPYQ